MVLGRLVKGIGEEEGYIGLGDDGVDCCSTPRAMMGQRFLRTPNALLIAIRTEAPIIENLFCIFWFAVKYSFK